MSVVLLGAQGQLGSTLTQTLSAREPIYTFTRAQLDITDTQALTTTLNALQPNIIINAAAYTAVDQAETDTARAFAINADAVQQLAKLSKALGACFIHYSTDYVFDGTHTAPYLESDPPNPINTYGASKLAGEAAILASGCDHLIFRTSWVMGPTGHNFAKTILKLAREHTSLSVIDDQVGVPTSTALIAQVTQTAINHHTAGHPWPCGRYHLAPQGKTHWCEIAKTLIALAGELNHPLCLKPEHITPIATRDYPTKAQRPLNSQLNTTQLQQQLDWTLPHWQADFRRLAQTLLMETPTHAT